MNKHGTTGWLVNTGWSGGSYGVGQRIKLAYTRKIIDAINNGSLLKANYTRTPVFGFEIPDAVDGVPSHILNPENTWSAKEAHRGALEKLAALFKSNFEKFVNCEIGGDHALAQEILAAGPQ